MLKALVEGIISGIILSFMIGPIFFGLLHTSIHKGFRKAILYASGVASSDTFFILITYFGIAGFMKDPSFQNSMTLIGGIIMSVFGVYYILKKTPNTIDVVKNKDKKKTSDSNMWLKGFTLNVVNPSVFLFWISMVSLASISYHNDKLYIFIFFASSIITVFGTDVLKAYIANKIKKYFTKQILDKMNKVLGIIILLAGFKLLYDFLKNSHFLGFL
jgi:threonine/homoserine/homoserine lactone efflux protein